MTASPRRSTGIGPKRVRLTCATTPSPTWPMPSRQRNERVNANDRPVILITGGARGIGAAIARAAASDYRVAISYLTSATAAKALIGDVTAAGTDALAARADMRTEADIIALFETVDRRFGRLDCLVNNAAT